MLDSASNIIIHHTSPPSPLVSLSACRRSIQAKGPFDKAPGGPDARAFVLSFRDRRAKADHAGSADAAKRASTAQHVRALSRFVQSVWSPAIQPSQRTPAWS